MFFRTLFDSLNFRLTRPPTRRSRRAKGRRFVARTMLLEVLEDRRLLTFVVGVNYPVGGDPQAVVTADFNNDGRLDVATANANSGGDTVSVLLGIADGTFGTALNSAVGDSPMSLAVGDFNADGKLDLVTAHYASGTVRVLLGNGNGTFGTATAIAIGSNPSSVAVGDFNGDGRLDLGVTSNVYTPGSWGYWGWYPGYYDGYANVLLGNGVLTQGDGTFAAPVSTWSGSGYHTSAAVADLNGDGKQDFASVNSDYSTVSVQLGTGTATLGTRTELGTGYYPVSVAAGDVNADGKLDLVTANQSGNNVSVLLNNGLGAFGAAQNYNAGPAPKSVAMADFNGDLKTDLVTANADSGTVTVLLGTGTGAFRPPVNVLAGVGPVGVAVGNFNGDGRPDVASANVTSRNVSVLLNDGTWPALDAPSITIGDVTVTEGNTGTVSAAFTVTLSTAYGQQVTVAYATMDGSAVVGSDYQAASGTLTFAPGVISQTITVQVIGDRLPEYTESFFVRLTDPTNAFVAGATGTGSILDDEPTVSINGLTQNEGNTGTTAFNFTVTLSAVYDAPVTVDYSTADLTLDEQYWYGPGATAGVDYTAKFGTLTFAAGETNQTITVLINGDLLVESDEYFFVNLSNPSSAAILGSSQAWGTILNDDLPTPSVTINDVTVTEGNTGTTSATFTVSLSNAYNLPITVHYQTADGNATAGTDYTASSGDVIFAAGQTSKTISVAVIGDRSAEPTETFVVNLTTSDAVLGDGQGVGTILDNEPRISINDVTVTEGNTGTVNATFTVTLSVAYDEAVIVPYTTANGSATAGTDYTVASGNITFAAGQTSKTITIAVIGDRLAEPTENFFVNLSAPSNAAITRGQGVGTIIDNEPRISINNVSMKEGNGKNTTAFIFTVTLSAAYDQAVMVNYATVAGGTATAGSDYQTKSGTVTFLAGETTKTITILVYRDNNKESDETFFVDLSGNSSNSLFTKNRGVGTILNDD